MLSESELQLVVGLCKTDRLPRLDGDPVVAMQLSLLGWLFGCNFHQPTREKAH
ncbi:hypothetical protein OO306_06145 [Pseudomonas sp. DCB_AW]|uniref:hypothetical protein n=1 Tax=Pseudomonas sp. DCB_AW TaxID=2993596 RepID=UPI002249A066|nr:hypothetical protein [Pseudomonas sp. DCB_AW]MCX2685131.1 hypothetical protein [Pseudomonas sp. DCB_AW]